MVYSIEVRASWKMASQSASTTSFHSMRHIPPVSNDADFLAWKTLVTDEVKHNFSEQYSGMLLVDRKLAAMARKQACSLLLLFSGRIWVNQPWRRRMNPNLKIISVMFPTLSRCKLFGVDLIRLNLQRFFHY